MKILTSEVSQPENVELLRDVPLFGSLVDADLARVAELFVPLHLVAGEAIYSLDDPTDAFFLVRDGAVALYQGRSTGPPRAFARLRRGDFFGELELLDSEPRRDAARAVEASVVLRIAPDDFLAFLEEHPIVALKLEMAAARGHSVKAAAALASAPRRNRRVKLHREVRLGTGAGEPGPALLVDMSSAGLCLNGVSEDWQVDRRVPFQLLWRDHAVDLRGRVAWRQSATVGVELADQTPALQAHLNDVLEEMLAGF